MVLNFKGIKAMIPGSLAICKRVEEFNSELTSSYPASSGVKDLHPGPAYYTFNALATKLAEKIV